MSSLILSCLTLLLFINISVNEWPQLTFIMLYIFMNYAPRCVTKK